MKILVIGHFNTGSLESSYARAFQNLGHQTELFELKKAEAKYKRFGRIGRYLTKFIPVEPWVRKINRELVVTAITGKIDLVVVVGEVEISPGALAQIKVSRGAKIAFVWPDPMVSLNNNLIAALPLFDLVGGYSKAALGQFRALGARRAEWLPFAGDPHLHGAAVRKTGEGYRYDVSFVGGWRPEREAALSELGDFKVAIWGPDWGRRCKGNKTILKAWQGKPAFGGEFAEIAQNSMVSLNVIDPTNYPAANMRFFELPLAGGLQLSSPCPEMEEEFRDGREVLFFADTNSLRAKIQMARNDPALASAIREAGRAKIAGQHTYQARARQIIDCL